MGGMVMRGARTGGMEADLHGEITTEEEGSEGIMDDADRAACCPQRTTFHWAALPRWREPRPSRRSEPFGGSSRTTTRAGERTGTEEVANRFRSGQGPRR